MIKTKEIISKILYINQYKDHITWSLSDVFFTSETLYDVGIIYGLELDSLHPPKPYLYMAISLILTLIIELSILLVFGFIKKHTFLVVALLNVLIQAILGLMVYFNIYQGRGPNFGILSMFLYAEVLILIIKVLTKTLFIKERTPIWSMTYAFVAGITSAIIGLIVIAHYVSNFINLP